MTLKHLPILIISLFMVSCCAGSLPQEPECVPELGQINTCVPFDENDDHPIPEADPDNPANPPRGAPVNVYWEALTEQCEWQPETEWCLIECTTDRANTRSWCETE